MRETPKKFVSLLALALVLGASAAYANTITVTTNGVTGGPGVFTWNYQIAEDADGLVQTGAVPGASTPFFSNGNQYADYFTIYDFVGFTGVADVTTPAGWAFQAIPVGSTDTNVAPFDNPGIVNLVWYYVGASPTPGPFTLTGFSAKSTLGSSVYGIWTSEDSKTLDSHPTSAAIGRVIVPAVVPEPATLLLLGCGLAGFAASRLRRQTSA